MANGWHRKNDTPAERARRAKYNDHPHQQARTHYAAEIAAGRGVCWRCGRDIPPGTPSRSWHVGHDDHDPSIIRGAEHATCNLKAGARKGATIANRARRSSPLTW